VRAARAGAQSRSVMVVASANRSAADEALTEPVYLDVDVVDENSGALPVGSGVQESLFDSDAETDYRRSSPRHPTRWPLSSLKLYSSPPTMGRASTPSTSRAPIPGRSRTLILRTPPAANTNTSTTLQVWRPRPRRNPRWRRGVATDSVDWNPPPQPR